MKHKHHQSLIDQEDIPPKRLEFLVDGVFAIAMTILVLDIHVPQIGVATSAPDLFFSLLSVWPSIFSFLISFIILGTFWVGHHTEFYYIKKLDHILIWQNIFYLLFVSLLPFSASLLGSYAYNQTAVMLYGLHLIILVSIHYFMWNHARCHTNLVKDNINPRLDKLVMVLTLFAIIFYTLAIVVSYWSVPAALLIYLFVPIPYIFGWIYRLV